MKRTLGALSLASLTMFGVAEAKELTFYFDVFSSGPEIYPCDAGVYHPKTEPYCHYKGTTEACEPAKVGKELPDWVKQTWDGVPIPKNDADARSRHACVCTGSTGSSVVDAARFKAHKWIGDDGDWDPSNGDLGWDQENIIDVVYGNPSGVSAPVKPHTVVDKIWGDSRDIGAEFKTQLEEVTFYLSSELYGAEYFVDLCFRGPQIPFYDADIISSWASTSWMQVSDGHNTGRSYLTMAKPKVQAEMVCDLQDESAGAPDESDFDNGGVRIEDKGNRIAGAKDWVGYLQPTASSGKKKSFSESLVVEAQKDLWKSWQISRENAHATRYCKARYYFKETPNNNNLKRERAWQAHDARFVLKWKVEEATDL